MANRIVVGAQWGDEGKAKVVDYLMDEADAVIRFQGGANAGHTVEIEDQKFIFHLIPSGIMRPDKLCVVGNGVVLDPEQLLLEISELKDRDISPDDRLFISDCAHVVFPYHKAMDQLQEKRAGKSAIGTTGRGIGPAYIDKVSRRGIRVGELLNPALLKKKVTENLEWFQAHGFNEKGFLAGEIIDEYLDYGQKLLPYVCDTVEMINEMVRSGKKLLFEGAQGTILDLDHGTHPFVTASNTVAGAACIGSGVGPTVIDEVIGVVKTYTTRVGNGPFPTELNDATGEQMQKVGHEFGATTGRVRRCGWFDAVVLRKAAMVNGLTHLAMTKLDVLDGFSNIKMCVAYDLEGKRTICFPSDSAKLKEAKPVYREFEGWKEPTSHVKKWEDLPDKAKDYLKALSEMVKIPVCMVSVGAKRDQTIKIIREN